MRYRVEVIETRSYNVTYTVEAESREEALEKAWIGETEREDETVLNGIADRYCAIEDVESIE